MTEHIRAAIVITTIGRPKLLDRLLASLFEQAYPAHEIVVVDQSDDEDVPTVVGWWDRQLPIRRLTSARGASVGRNVGLAALGDYDMVTFPDDDSQYAPDTLALAAAAVRGGVGMVSGRLIDLSGASCQLDFGDTPVLLDDRSVWTKAIAETCFFSADFISSVGGFDERLGIGCASPWQSGAETDLLLRGLNAGWRLVYDPEIVVYEENPDDPHLEDRAFRAKARHAARGTGQVFCRHYSTGRCLQAVVRPLGGAALNLARGRWATADWYLQKAVGRLEGITGRLLPAPPAEFPQRQVP